MFTCLHVNRALHHRNRKHILSGECCAVLGGRGLTGEGHEALVVGLQAPLESSDVLVEGEGLAAVFEAQDAALVEQSLVHVGVGLAEGVAEEEGQTN